MKKTCMISIMILMLFSDPAYGHPRDVPVTKQVKTINLFFKVLSKTSVQKYSDLVTLFGHHGDHEYGVLIGFFPQIDFSKVEWSNLPPEVREFLKKYTPPQEKKSRYLQCIKFSEPDKFEDNLKIDIQLPPKFIGSYNDREFTVTRGDRTYMFQFDSDETMINRMIFPNGKNEIELLDQCPKLIKLDVEIPKINKK